MRNLKYVLSILHREEQGAMKQTIEAICVGVVMVGILFTTAVMFNGGILSKPAEASSTNVPGHLQSSPGSMISNIVTGEKVSDTITNDLKNLADKVDADTGQPANYPSGTTDNKDN